MVKNSWISRLYAFIVLGRPIFLVAGVIFHALGIAAALYSGATLDTTALLWGQIAITAIQWTTHYSNDYFDLKADRANPTPTNWSGGSRILTDDVLPPQVALITALVMAGIAVTAAIILRFAVGTGALTIPLILLALFLAWFYSAPPLRLHSRGLGELVGALLIPGLTVLTGFYLQYGRLTVLPLLAIFPLSCLQFCMLLAVAFPDAAGDSAVGKRTLVVRLGSRNAAQLYAALMTAAYLSLPLLVVMGLPALVALAIGLMSPLALWQLWRIKDTRDPLRWNRFAFFSIGLLFGTAVVEAVAFMLLVGVSAA